MRETISQRVNYLNNHEKTICILWSCPEKGHHYILLECLKLRRGWEEQLWNGIPIDLGITAQAAAGLVINSTYPRVGFLP